MKVRLSDFPHQPRTLGCCEECKKIEISKRDCYDNPINCPDFCIANFEFIEAKKKEIKECQ